MKEDKVIALCAVLLLSPLATLAAEGLYFSASTGMVLPAEGKFPRERALWHAPT